MFAGMIAAGAVTASFGIGINTYRKTKKVDKSLVTILADTHPQEETLLEPSIPIQEWEIIDTEHEAEVIEANRCLVASVASLGFVVMGFMVYQPLMFLSIPLLAYSTIPVWRAGYEAITKDRRVRIAVLDSVTLPILVGTGNFLAAALDYTLYYVAEKILIQTRHSSKQNLLELFAQTPATVFIWQGGQEVEKSFHELVAGDVVIINAGQMVPVDGVIVKGYASLDQRMLTGEAQPAEKEAGEQVLAATIVIKGKIFVEVEHAGQDTVAAEIRQILQETSDYTSGFQLKGKEIADRSALPTLLLGLVALPIVGQSGALAVLCTNMGDTIRFTGPLSILNFIYIASRQGIMIKDGRALELLSEVDTVVFDKTGTLTLDEPHVGHIHACADLDEDTVLMFVAAAETRQTHPIARAILTEASQRRLQLPTIQDADYEIGYGLKVQTGDKMVWVGSKRFMTISDIEIPSEISPIESQCDTDGHSLVYAAINGHLVGVIELRPTIRPEAKQIVQSLQARKMHMYIISGDREGPTKKLAQELNIPHYFAETLPENKASLIEELQNQGKAVCFVGDGINDSIALKQANVSVSLQGASTIATDTAQIILMDGSLKQLNALFQLANVANKNMQRNLMTTFIPGLICIGGVFFLHFGILYAIAFYNIGLVTGVINALWPMIVYQKQLSSQQHAYLGSKIGESHDPNIMPLPE